jgi:hypothetical protein
MNYDRVFNEMQGQYQIIATNMETMGLQSSASYNNNIEILQMIKKILKRIARIEDKLKIVNIEEETKEGV